MPNDDWMKMTKGGKRKSPYSGREPTVNQGAQRREGDYRAEKMDKGLPLKKQK